MEKKVFLPFNPQDLSGTTKLLISEMKVYLENKNFSSILDSENGGYFFTVKNEDQKAEIHLTTLRGQINILAILYKKDKYVKDTEITTPEELSMYFPILENFLQNKN